MKAIADRDRRDSKIVVIGVNRIGSALVQDLPDLASRFEVVSLGRQPDSKIAQMITLGEHAANVTFRDRQSLIAAARGSFAIAQTLCREAARRAGINQTAPRPTDITIPLSEIRDSVHQNLDYRFRPYLSDFTAWDEVRPPRGACLLLLWHLSRAKTDSVLLQEVRHQTLAYFPGLEPAFVWLMDSNLARHFNEHPQLTRLLHYNRSSKVLSTEDPQLRFYLEYLDWADLARSSGHHLLGWDSERGPIFPSSNEAAAPSSEKLSSLTSHDAPRPGVIPPAEKRRDLWVLQLSDLHFEREDQAELWFQQLALDLREVPGLKRLDAVVASGDIANHATADEYAAAVAFFNRLSKEYKLKPQELILVPGNHDLNWERSKAAYSVYRRDDWKGALREGCFIDGGHYIEVRDDARYLERMKPFSVFYEELRNEAYPLEPEQQFTLTLFEAPQVLILGLNSSWNLDHHFRDRASIHMGALSRALDAIRSTARYRECRSKVAVWHHPIKSPGDDRIKDDSFLELLAQAGFQLALHGHIHKVDNGLYCHDRTQKGRRLHIVAAGTFGAPVREWVSGFPLQYQVLHFTEHQVTIHTRCREDPHGAWRPDARWRQGDGKDPLPRYPLELS